MNIHSNTKNCDPRLEARKQNFARSIYIHSNTKNCDPRHEACKQNSTISNDALNTNSFHQNAEICTTNNRSYSQSGPLLHDRKNVDCNQSLDKLQSINPECPRKNPCRENESSENSCQDRKEVSSKDTGFRQALVDVVKAMFDLRRNKHFEEKIIARNQGDKASNNDNKLDGQKLNQTISANKDDYNLVRQSRNQPNKLSIDKYKHARQTVKQQIKPNKAESKQVVETRIQAKSIDTYQDNSQNGRVKHMQCERSSNFLKTSPVLSKTVKHTKETNEKPTTLETTQSSDKLLPCNSNAIMIETFLPVYLTLTAQGLDTQDKLNKESNSLHTDKISDDCLFSSAENSEDDRLLPDEKDEKSVKENYEDEFEDKCLILQGDIPQICQFQITRERNCDSKGSNNITEKTGVHGNNNCKTPSPSKMSPKAQSTGKDFSFLELGYCPLALPLGCYAYEEDADRDENNNDSPKRLDFDPDIVATNKHMRMLCDEKYNHDNTEILTPWVIRYLDEIPKPTIRKEFLDKMDLELNENEFNHHHILQASIASPENDDSDGEDIDTDRRESPRIIPLDSHFVKNTRKTHQIRSLLNSSLEDTLSDLNSIQVSDDTPLIIPSDSHYVKDTIKTHQTRSLLNSSLDDTLSDLNSIPVSDDECDWSLGESEDDSSTDNYSERVPGDYSDEVPGESDQNEDKTDCAVGKSNHSKKSLQSEFDPESSGNRTEVTDNTKDENHKHLFQRETLLLKDNSVDNKANNSKTDLSLSCEPSKKIDSKKRKDEISNIDKKSDNLKEDAGKGDNLMLPQGTTKLLKKKVVDTESSSTLSTKKTRTKKRFSPTENQLFQEAMNFLCSGKIKDNNEKIIDCFSNSTIRTRQKSSNIGKDVEQGEARKKKQESSSLVEKDIVHADNVKKKRCCKPSKVKELKEKQKNILDNLKSQKEIISLEKKQEDNGENCDSIGETKDNCEPKTKTIELNKEVTKASKDRKYLIDDTEKQDEDKLDHSSVLMPASVQDEDKLDYSSVVMPVSEQLKCFLKRPEISMDVLPSKQKDLPLKRQDISPEESEALTGLLTLGESHKSVETQTLYKTDSRTCSEKRTILNSLCEVKSDRTTQNSLCEVKSDRTTQNSLCEVKSNRTIQNSSCEVKSDETYNKHSSDKILQKSELENEIDHRINKLLNDVRGKMLNGDKSEENGQDKGKNKQRGNGLYHNKEEQKDNKKGKHEENCKVNKKDKQEQNGDVCKRHEELKNLDEQKDKQEQNLEDDNKDKELQNPEGHQMDKQEHNLVDDKKYNQEKILKGDQKNEKGKHEQNLKSDICDGQEQNSKEEHDSLPFLIAAATEKDQSVPIDTTVQSGSTDNQAVTASNHTQSPGSNEYLEHSDSDTIPLVEKTVVEEKTPGKWLIPILERLNIDISKGRLIVTKTAQKLCIKTGTLIKSTCSYSSQTSLVEGKEERNIDNSAIDMIAVGDKSNHLENDSQNHDELNIENVNSSITKSKKRKKGKNLSDNSMELRSQGTTNTKKWKKLKESDDMLVPRITRNRALQVSKNPTINFPSKKGNLKKKKTSGKKLNETDAICPEINDISKEDDIDKSTESFCHKKSDSSNKKSKGKGTKRKLEFDGRQEETNENRGKF
ncbi:Hypothetical predicted protein [Mytilus galloprovincialis]|uniref:Uncharacterized protein n=1 Tax=Mytilus galloprovincialis TaxID=29158 RepID=A0A8B6EXF7_MYTGA|nr:Hypothetical predicted protein [Mytilus galloprovincialis]